ncbi:MAG: murein L,D-transpeptidase catalytic domain family protein [Flavisolibacter sp.]
MKIIYLPLSALCLSLSLLFFPVKNAGSKNVSSGNITMVNTDSHQATEEVTAESASLRIYDSLKLNNLGLSKEAMLYAYKGHQSLVEKGLLSNPDVLTVCDFTQSSQSKRMYIIDIKNYKVLLNTYVAHGRNSGLDYADKFSNRPESLESSLGFYVTKNTYLGKHGLSLKLSGLDHGFNDNAESRDVVVHGAPYIGDQRLNSAYMGRSFGCPAVPQKLATKVINLIKNGTCLFIYHPNQSYFQNSTILNG